jgi:hypothetical protein
MKQLLISAGLLLGIVGIGCSGTDSAKDKTESTASDSAKIEFEEISHNFGEIKEGEVVSTVYKFKNTGTRPLEILDVQVSCGCTVAEKPEKPVGVGQAGEIKVNFNSEGKPGVNKKYVNVISNASNSNVALSFSVIVNMKEEVKTN